MQGVQALTLSPFESLTAQHVPNPRLRGLGSAAGLWFRHAMGKAGTPLHTGLLEATPTAQRCPLHVSMWDCRPRKIAGTLRCQANVVESVITLTDATNETSSQTV